MVIRACTCHRGKPSSDVRLIIKSVPVLMEFDEYFLHHVKRVIMIGYDVSHDGVDAVPVRLDVFGNRFLLIQCFPAAAT